MKLDFSTSIYGIEEINDSFAKGTLRVAYTGLNCNNSFISKEVFENCFKTAYNCPIVAHYIEEDNDFGGHDIGIKITDKGDIKLINKTTPVGVVPESANHYWEVIEENDVVHEYLCMDVLIWKRQKLEYEKIRNNDFTKHSMEITIQDKEWVDGYLKVNKFQFTAFCLLGDDVQPCFESSQLTLDFNKNDFRNTYSLMMNEIKDMFGSNFSSEQKGVNVMDEKNQILSKYNLTAEDITFDFSEMSIDEFEQAVSEFVETKDNSDSDNTGDSKDKADDENENFTLNTMDFIREVQVKLAERKVYDEFWGFEVPQYFFVEIQNDEIIVEDCLNWNTYGLKFTTSGDAIDIDFDSKKRKKRVFADFDNGDNADNNEVNFTEEYFSRIKNFYEDKFAELQTKVTEAESKYEAIKAEKDASDKAFALKKSQEQLNELFSRFETRLKDNEEFSALKKSIDIENLDIDMIENTCFAILGRMEISNDKKFTASKKTVKNDLPIVPITTSVSGDEPYGGLFRKYGFEK